MLNLLHILNGVFQSSIRVLEWISSKAHWSFVILLLTVCFLFTLGGNVFYDIALFKDYSLTLQNLSAIIIYNISWSVLMPLALCEFWGVRYLVIRLLRGQGSFLTHGWVDFVCITPFVIAVACLLPLPINTWTTMLFLLLLLGFLYTCVLNIRVMSKIHSVQWKAVLVSIIPGFIAIPITLTLIVALYIASGITELPYPS